MKKIHLHRLFYSPFKVSEENLLTLVTTFFFFFCIVLATISSSKTSLSAVIVIDALRNMVVFLVVIFGLLNVFLIVRRNKIKIITIGVLIFATIYFFYGLILSVPNGGFLYFSSNPKLFLYVLLSLLFCFAIGSITNNNILDGLLRKSIILYAMFIFALNLYCGGLIIDVPPYFIYQYGDKPTYYSQGLTMLFMIAAISSMTTIIQRNSDYIKKVISLFLTIFFILLSFLNASRGELIIGITLILIILLFRKPKYLIIMTSIIFIIFMITNIIIPNINDKLLLVRRMDILFSGDFSMRDVLASQALTLIYENPLRFLFGGGFNYFQTYYSYEYGLYPHNLLLELIITFGLPVGIVTMLLLVIGIIRVYKKQGLNLFMIIGIYILIWSLKSGSIIDFLAVGYLAYFVTIGMLSLLRPIKDMHILRNNRRILTS